MSMYLRYLFLRYCKRTEVPVNEDLMEKVIYKDDSIIAATEKH